MKKELVAVILLLAVIDFASGFWTGRQFPTHHYEHLFPSSENASNAIFLFDTATGRVCSAFKSFQEQADNYVTVHPQNAPKHDPWDQALSDLNRQDASKTLREVDPDINPRNPISYIPPCGEQNLAQSTTGDGELLVEGFSRAHKRRGK